MILFCQEKCREIFYSHGDRLIELFGGIEIFDKFCDDLLLVLTLSIDRGRIVISSVCKLAICLSRIDLSEIEFDELLIGDEYRIVDDFDSFTMFRIACTDFLIACIFGRSSCISGESFFHSDLGFEYSFHTPETSTSKVGS